MKLLFCTQIMDEKDPMLGLYHTWVSSLASKFTSIEVVCLQEGEHHLPANVRVHSLGKESLSGARIVKRMRYIIRLVRYSWRLRGEYDAVFVHMNQEFILVDGWLWKLLGKHIYFWRNHYDGDFFTDVAAAFCTKVFCTSRYSYTAKYKKTVFMPVGVDTSILETHKDSLELLRTPRSVLSIGRISSSKNIHLLIAALGTLHAEGVGFTASVYGKTAKEDEPYLASLKEQARSLGIESLVSFNGPLPKTDTYKAYRTHEISVNASPSGMLDKTMFSGMMHECLIIVSNKDLEGQIPPECSFEEGSAPSLTNGLRHILSLSDARKAEIRSQLSQVVSQHSLEKLTNTLFEEMHTITA